VLIPAGDNPERLASETSFAALCGASPVEAFSGGAGVKAPIWLPVGSYGWANNSHWLSPVALAGAWVVRHNRLGGLIGEYS